MNEASGPTDVRSLLRSTDGGSLPFSHRTVAASQQPSASSSTTDGAATFTAAYQDDALGSLSFTAKKSVFGEYFRRGRLSTAVQQTLADIHGPSNSQSNKPGFGLHDWGSGLQPGSLADADLRLDDPYMSARQERLQQLRRQSAQHKARKARAPSSHANYAGQRDALRFKQRANPLGDQPDGGLALPSVSLFGWLTLPNPLSLRRSIHKDTRISEGVCLNDSSDEDLTIVTSYDPEGDGSWDEDLSEQVEQAFDVLTREAERSAQVKGAKRASRKQ